MVELRCQSKLHAMLEESVVEVKCGSRWCGAKSGVVVLHRFRVSDGTLVETKQFADPANMRSQGGGKNTNG